MHKVLIAFLILSLSISLFYPQPATAADDVTYVAFRPMLIANLKSRGLKNVYLQIEIEFMVENEPAATAIRDHKYAIRHHMIMLFSEQNRTDLLTEDGKLALREAALEVVQSVLAEEYEEPPVVKAVLFAKILVE